MSRYASPFEAAVMGATNAPGIAEAFKGAMRHVPGAVTIITTGGGEHRRGLTATAMCSVCASPPTILVCVNRSADAHSFIVEGGAFCVNLLGAQDQALANRFASLDGSKGTIRFEGREWKENVTGAPVLEDALASLDCRVTETFDTETHTIFIGLVHGVQVNERIKPLIYYDRSYRELA